MSIRLGKTQVSPFIKIQSGGVANLGTLKITPTSTTQSYLPDSYGYDAFSKITVAGDFNLIPENIRNGVSIFGVNGTLDASNLLDYDLEFVLTDGKTQTIKPSEGFSGVSMVYIDNTELLLKERNYEIITTEEQVDLFYDISSTAIRDYLFYSRTELDRVYLANASSIDQYAFYNCLDLTELKAPKCENIGFSSFRNSYRLNQLLLPSCDGIEYGALENTFNTWTVYGDPVDGYLEVGHLEYIDSEEPYTTIGAGRSLRDILIGDSLVGTYVNVNDNPYFAPPVIEDTAVIPDKYFDSASNLQNLIIPEISSTYELAGDLFTTIPTNFRIYVDESMVDTYKSLWSQYVNRIRPLTEAPGYRYNFEFDTSYKCYQITNYLDKSQATQSNNISLYTPRAYKELPVIIGGSTFSDCTFNKLTIGRNTFKLNRCFNINTRIDTLEFEDISTLHSIAEDTFRYAKIENVILNCSVKEWFSNWYDTTIGIKLSSPFSANHVYTYPGFELTTVVLPEESVQPNEGGDFNLPNGIFAFSHFENVYLNNKIQRIIGYSFEGVHDSNIYIPNSVTYMNRYAFLDAMNCHIYCEAESKPEGWDEAWDDQFTTNNVVVHWGHKF